MANYPLGPGSNVSSETHDTQFLGVQPWKHTANKYRCRHNNKPAGVATGHGLQREE